MFYDEFADSYDEMIDWQARLEYEKLYFSKLFKKYGVKRILDVACGTGMHSILFNKMGYRVVGIDNSPGMLEQARRNAKEHGAKGLRFIEASLTSLPEVVKGRYEAIVCLGNSLPHLVDDQDIVKALSDFYSILRTGGILIMQIVHFDHYLDSAESAVAVVDGFRYGKPVTFRRHYEFKGTKVIFHVSVYERDSRDLLENYSTPINAIRRELLETFMEKVGFGDIQFYSDLAMNPLTQGAKSLVTLAQRTKDQPAN